MIAPVWRLKKKEITWLGKNRCKHSHTYLEHYACFLEEHGEDVKIGFFDIETSNLKADYGLMLCYCILDSSTGDILESCITKEDLRTENILDKRVVKNCIDDLRKFDKIVGHYSTNFDIPYTRARAEFWNIPFLEYGELYHRDTYYMARRLLAISSRRLGNVCNHLFGETNKTRIDSRHWILALQGDKNALDYIVDHCRKDVIDLQRVYRRLEVYTKDTDKSI